VFNIQYLWGDGSTVFGVWFGVGFGFRDKRGRDKGAARGPVTKYADDKFIYCIMLR
jgi:hypothetical protein